MTDIYYKIEKFLTESLRLSSGRRGFRCFEC